MTAKNNLEVQLDTNVFIWDETKKFNFSITANCKFVQALQNDCGLPDVQLLDQALPVFFVDRANQLGSGRSHVHTRIFRRVLLSPRLQQQVDRTQEGQTVIDDEHDSVLFDQEGNKKNVPDTVAEAGRV
jgi:hypothetical protein